MTAASHSRQSTADTMASFLEDNSNEFLDFVKRVQARNDDDDNENNNRAVGMYLDLYDDDDASCIGGDCCNADNEQHSSNHRRNNQFVSTVRIFLQCNDDVEKEPLTSSQISSWMQQIDALPKPLKRRKLQLHVLLTRSGCNTEEEVAMTASSPVVDHEAVSSLAKSIREILRNVSAMRDAKIFLYAKDDWNMFETAVQDGKESRKVVGDDFQDTNISETKSTIEKLHFVLIKSSNFTSFHPSANAHVPTIANQLIQQLLPTLHKYVPNLEHVTLECDKRQTWGNVSNRSLYYHSSTAPPCLPSLWLEWLLLYSSNNTQHNTNNNMSLMIHGWTLTMATMQVLCRVLRATPPAISPPQLEGLTLSMCRWDLSCRTHRPNENSNEKSASSSVDLVSALAHNTSLKELHLNLARIPPGVFCWQHLADAFAVHPALQSFETSLCMKEDAFKSLLQAYQRSETLQDIRIPFFFGTWTDKLLEQLRDILFSKRKNGLRKVNLTFQHVPARWSNDPAPLHRRKVWALFKQFLLSNSASDGLHLLHISNLTLDEMLELATVLRKRQMQSGLRHLQLDGSISLTALVTIVESLGTDKFTRIIPTHLKFELWAGDEIHATEQLTQLGQAMKIHCGVMALDVKCAEYSATPNANVLKEVYKHSAAAATIESMLGLNNAGRRSLLNNPHCLYAGTQILAHVSQHQLANAIFHHIVEHSSLMVGSRDQ